MTGDATAGARTAPVQPEGPPADAALKSAVTRLAALLEHETTALRQRRPVALDELCDRKNQALLELSRIGQRLDGRTLDPELQSLLRDLHGRLDENRSVLELHLRAVRAVADILSTAIRDAESDGTYSTPAAVQAGT